MIEKEAVKKPAKKRNRKGPPMSGHYREKTNKTIPVKKRLAVNEAFAEHVKACEKNGILKLVTDYDVFVREALEDPDFMKPPVEGGELDGGTRNYQNTYSGDWDQLVWKG